MLAVVLAIVLMVTGMSAWRWWTQPTLFTHLGDGFHAAPQPLAKAALSTTVVFPQTTSSAAETVTIERLDASFDRNTAKAEATFWLCHMRAGEDPIGGH